MRPATTLEVEGRPLRLLRPLLGARARRGCATYCLARGLAPREDPSNQDRPLPAQPGQGGAAAAAGRPAAARGRGAGAAGRAWPPTQAAIVAAAVEAVLAGGRGGRGGPASSIDRAAFGRLAPPLQRALLRVAAEEALGASHEVTLERVEAARRAILTGRGGSVLEWPGPLRITLAGRRATFAREA